MKNLKAIANQNNAARLPLCNYKIFSVFVCKFMQSPCGCGRKCQASHFNDIITIAMTFSRQAYFLYSSLSFGRYSLNSAGTPVTGSYSTVLGCKVTCSAIKPMNVIDLPQQALDGQILPEWKSSFRGIDDYILTTSSVSSINILDPKQKINTTRILMGPYQIVKPDWYCKLGAQLRQLTVKDGQNS